MDDQEIGLRIYQTTSYGTVYVKVTVTSREAGRDYPVGVPWYAFENKPFLDGLSLVGHIAEDWKPEPRLIGGCDAEFYDVYSINAAGARAMAKTLDKVNRQILKDEAREPGDVFMSLARAIGAKFAVFEAESARTALRQWVWVSVAEGRNYYRRMIEKAVQEACERRGIRQAAA